MRRRFSLCLIPALLVLLLAGCDTKLNSIELPDPELPQLEVDGELLPNAPHGGKADYDEDFAEVPPETDEDELPLDEPSPTDPPASELPPREDPVPTTQPEETVEDAAEQPVTLPTEAPAPTEPEPPAATESDPPHTGEGENASDADMTEEDDASDGDIHR